MYKRKTLVAVLVVTLLEASVSFADASCKVSISKTYPITNNHGSKLGELRNGSWVRIKGSGPRFQFESEAHRVAFSEENNQSDWFWRNVEVPAYVDLGWSKNCN